MLWWHCKKEMWGIMICELKGNNLKRLLSTVTRNKLIGYKEYNRATQIVYSPEGSVTLHCFRQNIAESGKIAENQAENHNFSASKTGLKVENFQNFFLKA